MDSTDEEFYGGSTSFTTKGRRTKRQRTTATSTYAGGSAYLENSYGSSASATPSDYHDVVSEVSIEEQDLANCLILLAHGVQKKRSSKNNITTNNNININGVYECKTCNKTFPSFQALGGHRTSHKKTIKPITISTPPKPKEQPPKAGSQQDSSPVPPPHEHVSIKPVIINRNTDKSSRATARVHECSICGSEFPSGQALGGHMRRHRPATMPLDSSINTIDIASTTEIDLGGVKNNNNNNILSLDLNLPAPSDDHDNEVVLLNDDDHDDDDDDDDESSHMAETKFHVIPSPALLMDCHY